MILNILKHKPISRLPSRPSQASFAIWAGACALATVLVTGAAAWQFHINNDLITLRSEVERERGDLQKSSVASSVVAEPNTNFAERLPTASAIDPIVSQFQRSGAELGVGFVSVSATDHAPTPQTLGRLHLSVMLRGSYPNLKAVLAEAFDRHPELVLERLTMRRVTAPADLEARVDLLLLTRPRPASGPGQ